ncbi:hypothetical protein BX285_4792 [Streptomyces sp. 1114.5]|uniref:hypothetical protein n=1 Tax=unclassified Streptomyces TaxID=2593676 RepID=UPI000BDB3AA5|nr:MULTISPECIES: hypothetical protein [unclassified Streptomyces]RKT10867.1 hypothetical protein BX285_4792 [Streptomyces sp. 1114.5]SOB81797.1 hypothetical protein SAMN06272789_1941 [Streptomyces sp. 1331.2]
MVINDDCANQRSVITRLATDYRSLDATTTATEHELAALQDRKGSPEALASVQERLATEREQLGLLAVEGQAAVDEFRAVCGGEQLPPLPWPAG